MICPCCSQEIAEPTGLDTLTELPLTSAQRAVLRALIRGYPRYVETERIITYVYSGARLPNWPRNQVTTCLAVLRRLLAPHGWTICHTRARVSMYRLEAVRGAAPGD